MCGCRPIGRVNRLKPCKVSVRIRPPVPLNIFMNMWLELYHITWLIVVVLLFYFLGWYAFLVLLAVAALFSIYG